MVSGDPAWTVVVAEVDDIPAWLELAYEVEPLFGPMLDDPGFHRALQRNIERGTAFCVRCPAPTGKRSLAGGLLFSPHPPQYEIGWLAVAGAYRRRGIGRALVDHVLSLVERPAEVWVTTFGPDQPEGLAARQFYERFGFTPAGPAPPGPDGSARQ
jgi:ribosomal protein S18 acetylase RimI-like enzyme